MNRGGAVTATIVAVALVATAAFGQQETLQNVQVTVEGDEVSFSAPVLMVDMQFPLLPAETYLAALGATSRWTADAQRLDVQLDGITLEMWVGRKWLTVNGDRQDIENGLYRLNDALYVPGIETARLLGLDAQWDPTALTLAVTRPTTMPEGPTVAATLLEVRRNTILVRALETGLIEEVVLAADPVIQRGASDATPTAATRADLQAGDLLDIVINENRAIIGLRATYSQTLGTIAAIEANQLTLQGGQSYPLGAGVQAIGSDSTPLHLLAAVGQGAILTINPATNEVWHILAQRSGTTRPPQTAAPVIAAFVLPRYHVALAQGGSLEIRIVGSAGATASVQLGGTGHTVGVPETAPGIYSGVVTIPERLVVPDEHLVAQLQIGGVRSSAVQSDRQVMIDAERPSFDDPIPAHQSTIADVNTHIQVTVSDQGVGVDPTTARLTVDGADVTDGADIDAGRIFYDTPGPLAPGEHTATASVSDLVGNEGSHQWRWVVEAPDRGILNVSHDATAPLNAGDTLTVTIEVDNPGQAASFSIDGVTQDVAMTRVEQTNSYRGTYTVQQGDAATQATISAQFTAADGTQYHANAAQTVSMATPDVPFAITTPTEGDRTGRRIQPAGTAPAGSTVRWTIGYEVFILSGNVGTGTVEADAAGEWEATEQVDLKLMLFGMADQYTLKAELLSAAGEVQDTSSVKFTARD